MRHRVSSKCWKGVFLKVAMHIFKAPLSVQEFRKGEPSSPFVIPCKIME